MSKAVVLLSGGLDSTTVLAHAIHDGHTVEGLNVMYGQKHVVEVERARAVANHYGIKLHEISLMHAVPSKHEGDTGYMASGVSWGGSALLNDGEVPTARSVEDMAKDIPITYVPARNLFLVGLATSLAEAIGADAVYVGFNALDYSGYPDCRPAFVQGMHIAMTLGTKRGVETMGKPIDLIAPIIHMSKAQIAQHGLNLKAPLHLTWSCYNPQSANGGYVPCGKCDSCLLRAKGFAEIGQPDPALK